MSAKDFLKKPNQEEGYTAEQILELQKCATDPVYFINNYCYIQNPALGKVKFILRPYQIKVIRALHSKRFNVLLQPRQTGKSETCAAFAYWFSIFNSNKNVLIASNKQRNAADILGRIKFMYENTPDFLRPGVLYYNRGSIEFDNDSKLWSEATTESTGRGKSISFFIADELAHVKRSIQDLMWASILPTLSTGGSCVVMSTPNGSDDLFAELWRQAQSNIDDDTNFYPLEVDNLEVPGRDEAWERMMISKLGESTFRQEYKNEFLSSDPLLINSLKLQGLRASVPKFEDKGFKFWKEPAANKSYIVGADVAEGMNQDFSTIQVFELDSLEQVAEFRNNKIKEDQLYQAIKWILTKILSYKDVRTGKSPTVWWSFENNSIGAVIGALYNNDEKFPVDAELVNEKGSKNGMRTGNKTKLEAARNLKNLVEKATGGFVIHSDKLIFEMRNYIQTGASYAAKTGATDDLISACLIVTRIIKQISEYEPEVFNKLYKSDESFYEETTNDFNDPMPSIFN